MTRPRLVEPGSYHSIVRRCSERRFFLRPDADTNNALGYCLALAAERFAIQVLMVQFEANHHHLEIYDRLGTHPAFRAYFHGLAGRCINARRGRWENLWAAHERGVTRNLDRETVIKKVIYAAANPVKDGLVERATQWPGVPAYAALLAGRSLTFRRPRWFFRDADAATLPESVTLKLGFPPALGEHDDLVNQIRAGVAAIEAAQRALRAQTGRRVLGRRAVRSQSWRDRPHSVAPRRGMRPNFAGRREHRIPMLQRYKAWLGAYREALAARQRGQATPFPPGTYWYARFTAFVAAAAPPPAAFPA